MGVGVLEAGDEQPPGQVDHLGRGPIRSRTSSPPTATIRSPVTAMRWRVVGLRVADGAVDRPASEDEVCWHVMSLAWEGGDRAGRR